MIYRGDGDAPKYSSPAEWRAEDRKRDRPAVDPGPTAAQIGTSLNLQPAQGEAFALGGGSAGGYGSRMGYQDDSNQLYANLNNYRMQLIRNYVSRYWR